MKKTSSLGKNRRQKKTILLAAAAIAVTLVTAGVMLALSYRQGSTDFRSQASVGKKGYPQGTFDGVDNTNCVIAGWTADADDFAASLKIHAYLDRPYHGDPKKSGTLLGEFSADGIREDVNKALKITGNHGFNVSLAGNGIMPKDGKDHKVYVYGINKVGTQGNNQLLAGNPKTLRCSPTPDTTIKGTFDAVDNANCVVAGWAVDSDDTNWNSKIHVYLDRPFDGDPAKSGKMLGEFTANGVREDVNKALKITGNHGFNVSLMKTANMPKDGKDHQIYIYGMNKEGTPGTNSLLVSNPKTLRCSPAPETTIHGNFGVANSELCRVYGWTGDSDKVQESLAIHIYKDKPYGQGGTLISAPMANLPRPDVNEKTMFKGNHGFDVSLSNELKGKGPTQLFIYSINAAGTPGTNMLLPGSPKTIECK